MESPARCCSRGVYRHVSVDASELSRTGPRLTTLVRCVVLCRGRRGKHPPYPCGEFLQWGWLWHMGETQWKGLRVTRTHSDGTKLK